MPWAYKRSITINHTKVSTATQSNFSVPIRLDSTNVGTTFKVVGSGGHIQNSSGYDIGFYSDSAGATPLFWEIDSYDGTNGVLLAWVKISSLSSSVDTVIYVFYGDATISTFQSTASSVWDGNYTNVWHLPNGTSLTASDSTTTANTGTVSGATAVSAQVDGGADFTVSGTGKITCSSVAAFSNSSALTLECWFKRRSSTYSPFLGQRTGNNGAILQIWNDGFLYFIIFNSYGFFAQTDTASWHHLVMIYDGTGTGNSGRMVMYYDGSLQTLSFAGTVPPNTVTAATNFYMGYDAVNTLYSEGGLDEVRVSNIARSSGWAITNYNFQSAPLSCITVGGETAISVVGSHLLALLGVG